MTFVLSRGFWIGVCIPILLIILLFEYFSNTSINNKSNNHNCFHCQIPKSCSLKSWHICHIFISNNFSKIVCSRNCGREMVTDKNCRFIAVEKWNLKTWIINVKRFEYWMVQCIFCLFIKKDISAISEIYNSSLLSFFFTK